MSGDFILTHVTKPSGDDLEKAILHFDEAPPADATGDEVMAAALVIVGEACAHLDDGKATGEVVSHLVGLGLSEGCATTFVDKAFEIVASNPNPGGGIPSAEAPVSWGVLIGVMAMASAAIWWLIRSL